MLSRIETFYLAILRVVILIIATAALVVAVLGVIGAAPTLLRVTGLTKTDVRGGTLGAFISEKKLSATPRAGTDAQGASTGSAADADQRVVAAGDMIARYLGSSAQMTTADWQRGMTGSEQAISPDQVGAYRDSEKDLAGQLEASHGRKLTEAQVIELVDWHTKTFVANAQAEQARAASSLTTAGLSLGVAVSAFVVFILIAFAFLFVKIERSLRVVRTQEIEGGVHGD